MVRIEPNPSTQTCLALTVCGLGLLPSFSAQLPIGLSLDHLSCRVTPTPHLVLQPGKPEVAQVKPFTGPGVAALGGG